MKSLDRGHREALLASLLLVLLAFAAYYPVLDNFFTWDDFLWLQRAKNLVVNPSQVFNLDAVYFDPLIYLWFWVDYQLHGLNYYWYHFTDISVHALNGLLVYLLVSRLSRDRLAALFSSILFVTSFAVVDTVAWSSSRVDLLAVFFSLLTLICFLKYLDQLHSRFLYSAATAFALALCSKGTPLLLPVLLATIILQRGEIARRWRLMLPFMAIVSCYLVLLGWKLAAVGKPLVAKPGTGLNLHNLTLSLVELFVPEQRLATMSVGLIGISLVVGISLSFFLLTGRFRQTAVFGLVLMGVGLAPVLILKDFRLVTSLHDAGHLLNSPSHRIYLASVGAACFSGALLAACSASLHKSRMIQGLLLIVIVYSLYEIRLRGELWTASARYIRASVEGLASHRHQLLDNSAIGLVNFPMSRGFMRPALDLYCGLQQVLLLPLNKIPEEILDSPEIFRYRKRGFFFVYGNNRVINLSPSFDRLLDVAFFYQVTAAPRERARLLAEYSGIAAEINNAIGTAMESSPPGLVGQEL